MQILIIYATYSSGTLEVTELLQEELQAKGHVVSIENAATVDPTVISAYDLVFLGSPSWWNNKMDGMPHHSFLSLMEKMKDMKFTGKKFAVFGLGDNTYARFCGAVAHLEKFVGELEGSLFLPSLKVDSFYFDRENNEKKIKNWIKNPALSSGEHLTHNSPSA